MAVQRGRSKRRGEAYSEYVEPLNDARTKLADFFNILLLFNLVRRNHLGRAICPGKTARE